MKSMREVTYQLEDDNSTAIYYLGCIELRTILPGQREIDLEELQAHLLDYFNRWKEKQDDYFDFDDLILDPVRSRSYLIWRKRFCLMAEDRDELDDISKLLRLEATFAFDNGTFETFQLRDPYKDEIDQIIVLNHKIKANCGDANASKQFHCLNKCFKEKERFSDYYYDENYDEKNRLVEEHEAGCFRRCRQEDCRITMFRQSGNFDPKFIIYKGQPTFSKKEFFIQLISLVCLFSNTYLWRMLSSCLSALIYIIRPKKRKVVATLRFLKPAVLLVSLALSLCLYADVFREFREKQKHPTRKETTINLFRPDPQIDLVLCTPRLPIRKKNQTLLDIKKITYNLFNELVRRIALRFFLAAFLRSLK